MAKAIDPALSNLPEVVAELPVPQTPADIAAEDAANKVFETDVSTAKSVEDINGTTVVRW